MKRIKYNTRSIFITLIFGFIVLINIILPYAGLSSYLNSRITIMFTTFFSIIIIFLEDKMLISSIIPLLVVCTFMVMVQIFLGKSVFSFLPMINCFIIGNSLARGSIKPYITGFMLLLLYMILSYRIFI